MSTVELSQLVPGPLGTPAGTVELLHLPTVSSRMDTVIRDRRRQLLALAQRGEAKPVTTALHSRDIRHDNQG